MRAATVSIVWVVPMLAMLSVDARAHEDSLIDAAKGADTGTVRALLQEHASDVNAEEADGTTALHWAVHRDDAAMVEALLDAGANVAAANRYGVTPLLLAAENGSAATIERLLAAGADPNEAGAGGETVLMTASRTGRTDAIEVLLAHGADVTARERHRSQTALMWASVAGNGAAITALIQAGADPNVRSETPEKLGRGGGGGANGPALPRREYSGVYPYGAMSPLNFAARRGHLGAARALLDGGADIEAGAVVLPGYGPASNVMLAIANGHYEMAAFLVDQGADPNNSRQGWTALHQLARARAEPGKNRLNNGWIVGPNLTGQVSGLDLARTLIEKGADVDAQATEEFEDYYRRQSTSRVGATPLLMASRVSDYQLMEILLDAGADPSLATIDGITPVMATAGVAIRTAGEDGVDEDSPIALKLLLDTGRVDIHATDSKDWTPLHGAAYRGVLPNIQMLVDAGARLDARAYGGWGVNLKTDLGKSEEGWLPVDVADGIRISWSSIFFRQPDAAILLRKLMAEQGLPVPEDTGLERGAAVPAVEKAVELKAVELKEDE